MNIESISIGGAEYQYRITGEHHRWQGQPSQLEFIGKTWPSVDLWAAALTALAEERDLAFRAWHPAVGGRTFCSSNPIVTKMLQPSDGPDWVSVVKVEPVAPSAILTHRITVHGQNSEMGLDEVGQLASGQGRILLWENAGITWAIVPVRLFDELSKLSMTVTIDRVDRDGLEGDAIHPSCDAVCIPLREIVQ